MALACWVPTASNPRMSTNPNQTVEHPANDPNKGLNVKTFSIAVLTALVVLLCIGFFIVRTRTSAASPEQGQAPGSHAPHNSSASSETGHTKPQ